MLKYSEFKNPVPNLNFKNILKFSTNVCGICFGTTTLLVCIPRNNQACLLDPYTPKKVSQAWAHQELTN
jgi:hypothetical protein